MIKESNDPFNIHIEIKICKTKLYIQLLGNSNSWFNLSWNLSSSPLARYSHKIVIFDKIFKGFFVNESNCTFSDLSKFVK